MTLGSRWNLSNTSLPPLGSLLLQRDMVQDSGKNYSIGFLRELPISLAYNTENYRPDIALPKFATPNCLRRLKRYEPQLRFALDAVKLDNTMLMALTATLHHIYDFKLLHQKHVAERKCAGPVFSRRWLHPEKTIGLRTLYCLSFPRVSGAGDASRRLLRPFRQKHDGRVSLGASNAVRRARASAEPLRKYFLTFSLLDVP